MALLTYLDLLDRIAGLANLGADEQAKAGRAITQADALAANFCGWPRTASGIYTMASAAYELYPRPAMGLDRALDHGLRWVSEITAAYVDDALEYGPATALTLSHLVNDTRRGLVLLKPSSSSRWSYGDRANKLELVAGFDATPDDDGYSTAPADLVAAVAMIARHLYDGAHDQGVESFTAGGQSTSLNMADAAFLIPRAAQAALEPYRVTPPYPLRELGAGHGC